MTNNPTIDGVSRERVEAIACEMDRLGYGHHESHAESILRAMLDAKDHPCPVLLDGCDGSCAPAVERQDLITFPRDLTDDMAEAIALRANCCGGIADDVWEGLVQCVEKPKHPDINVCGSWPVQSEPRPRISELQSTIAQLQARIWELESGRGEPFGYVDQPYAKWLENKTSGWTTIWATDGADNPARGKPSVALFTAPPAPVAVVLPERMEIPDQATFNGGNAYYAKRFDEARSWNACLDATAALNEQVK